MTALRRGACPDLMQPMQTGDGLLARMAPLPGSMTPRIFRRLCEAAQQHGNGIVEITQRGNIQIRGLSAASAPRFAEEISELGIESATGVPIITNPLAGLDPNELIDANMLAARLRAALDRSDLPTALDAKVSVVIDDGGTVSLDALSADIRLCAARHSARGLWQVSVAGNAAEAASLGAVAPEHAAEAIIQLLHVIAANGREARA